MDRRSFLGSLAALAVLPAASPPLLLLSDAEAEKMRGAAAGRAAEFAKYADRALKAGPWSVTFARPSGIPTGAGPNDYYSEGPYWWPDPKNPTGPYIRKDGERNPERFLGNRNALSQMCEAVLSLGIGAFLLGQKACAERAAKVLAVWFVDPKTRMNPNLEFGQAVRGVNDGRGTGIIDTVSLIHAAQGVVLAEQSAGFDKSVAAGVREWYRDYLKWLTTSKKGLDEKKATNNHATWWTAQAAAYALFTSDAANLKMAWQHYRTHLLKQIEPDGSCPREEARTNSLSYSAMNLDGFSVLCKLAERDGLDLWHSGVEKSFTYLMPYVVRPESWQKQQIGAFNAGGTVFLGLAGMGLHSQDLLAAHHRLPRADSPWVRFLDLLVAS